MVCLTNNKLLPPALQEQPLSDAITDHHLLPSSEDRSQSNMEVEVSDNQPSPVVEDQPLSNTELVQPSSITEDQPSPMIEDQPCTKFSPYLLVIGNLMER